MCFTSHFNICGHLKARSLIVATSVVNKQSHPAVSKGKSLSLIKDQL